MFSKECCHILSIQFELFHVLVINACQSQDDCSVSFLSFPYTVIFIVMTSPESVILLCDGIIAYSVAKMEENYSLFCIVKP